MFGKIVKLVVGTKHERDIKRMLPVVEKINALEPEMQKLETSDFARKSDEFRKRVEAGESLDDILPEAFALVREAAWRSLGLRHFDVQLMGGMVLHGGRIAEMKTGEGKTLTSTLPVYLNALSGKGVHVVTVNDYLARRDAAWMKPVFELLGVSVGVIQHEMNPEQRKGAYGSDITYGTNNEFGFDFLRDNMVSELDFRVQRGFNYAIVDEVDSILIDEARTPLIISGPADENTDKYNRLDKAIRQLLRDEEKAPEPEEKEVEPGKEEPHVLFGWFFDIDEKSRNVLLTEEGVKRVEELLGVENLYAPENVELVAHTNQALKAHLIFKDEVDYVVREGEVIIVDEHTGRLMEGRRYSDGLHQAIEAKEGVTIKQETQTLASVTFQNFFRLYSKLSGMTGTADTEAEEFRKIYGLEVVVVPTNEPVRRIDYPDRVYRTELEKFEAIAKDIELCREAKQPVLVGTVSIEKSELLSSLLRKHNIPHNVLNAKQHQKEAEIVENAGKPGAVTVATNMAGRGTDIVLGGAPLYLKDLEDLEETEPAMESFKEALRKKQFDRAKEEAARIKGSTASKQAKEVLDRANIWLGFHKEVKEAGGLHIVGTERHEARRIDNQLRGRSGRQGDPGSSRFYLSLEDNLMRLFGGPRIMGLMERLGMTEGQELEAGMVDRAIARAQKRVESHNFDIRKHLLEYDDVMNRQREIIYAERDKVLEQESIRDTVLEWSEEVLEQQILDYCDTNDPTRWDLASLEEWLLNGLGMKMSLSADDYKVSKDPQATIFAQINEEAQKFYNERVEAVGDENFRYIEKRIAIDIIDARWKEHLYQMDHLREGIWASSYSEKNPLVEYKLQGFKLFDAIMDTVKAQIVEFLFRVQIEGPVEQTQSRRRNLGTATHESMESFEAPPPGQARGAAPGQIVGNNGQQRSGPAPAVVSGGGASKRKGSRRRKRK
ncbi:MAG: preprotein translocase subunit SecA [Leptospiraceae bacterium]|nr:preprotein translocase subunit SecA [Leptospiraceae bacterium]